MQNNIAHESYPWVTSGASDLYLGTQQAATRTVYPNISKTTNLTSSRDYDRQTILTSRCITQE